MAGKRKRPAGTSSKGSRSAAKKLKTLKPSLSRGATPHNRKAAFDLVRGRREGMNWKEAEKHAGMSRRAAKAILPSAFFRDEQGHLQVRGYDRYTRRLKVQTTQPGQFKWVRARGSRQASLVGEWSNAVKVAGGGDFSLIDAFPRNLVIDGVRLVTSHREVSRIAAAANESDEPFEDLYSLVGAA